MVVLPYKDRLELFSRYLQQLIMESLGKERDLDGKVVNQGLTVFGNKGSTDQHAYVQQLRDGLHNFFVVFIEVLSDRTGLDFEVEPQVTSGDYLFGFFMGTRQALHENGRQSVTLTLTSVQPATVGGVIALFERTVGLYATLVNVNAYHQPGVEAGKKAAESVIQLQTEILRALTSPLTVSELAARLGTENSEAIFKICEHLAANGRLAKTDESNPFEATYRLS
jgi:glucose-6-phosphate isomerase